MSGEHPEGRKAMDNLIKRAVDSGMPVDRARELARKAAQDHDRKKK